MSDRLRDLNERIAALLRKGSPIPDAVGPSPAPSVDQPIFDEDVLEESVIESPIVGGDKLQAQQNALAEILSEPPMVSTNTEPPLPSSMRSPRNKPQLTLQPMREIGRSRQSHCWPDWTLTPRSASTGRYAISEASERNCRPSARTI